MLVEDGPTVLRYDIGAELGYARVLAAVGTGITRRGKIQNAVGQRIEHALEVLQRSGLVRRSTPLGAPRRADPVYEVHDPFLRFWYSVLYRNVELVEGGQGAAVLAREKPAWDRHVAWVWEELARAHAVSQVGDALPPGLLVGRWWDQRGQHEIDVLGLEGGHLVLVGEARWRHDAVDLRDVRQLRDKARHTPYWIREPMVCVWSRAGLAKEAKDAGVREFGPADVVGG